jgi:hypothetical protein
MRKPQDHARVLPVHGVALFERRDIDILVQRAMQTSSNSDPVMFIVAISREDHQKDRFFLPL